MLRHIDTAEMYNNERYVGEVVKASGIPREEFFICMSQHMFCSLCIILTHKLVRSFENPGLLP